MIQNIYRGSVKDLLGPVQVTLPGQGDTAGVIFEYSDAYSVFDWGRMPDLLPGKGQALAILAAHWLGKIEQPETWKEFSRTQEALKLRKGNRFGASFNDLGEKLQQEGMRTHYLGAIASIQGNSFQTQALPQMNGPFKHLLVRQVSAVKPAMTKVMGRELCDYAQTRNAKPPRLVPLEFVFRFSCPPGSSLIERVSRDPDYLAHRGFAGWTLNSDGGSWDFPVIEMFTKLESTDRPVGLAEALAISGITAEQLQELMFKTAWVAGFIRSECARNGLELADGKLEWALDERGGTMLVDSIGPDELRILKNGMQLSKEFLRSFYRTTPWYESVVEAKKQAAQAGVADWKKAVKSQPPALPAEYRDAVIQLYQSLANALGGRGWFPNAWSLNHVVETLQGLQSRSASGGSS